MNAANRSSIHAEEWRQLFDILDESLDGRMDGIIRVEDFKKMLKEDPLWGEAVPRDVQAGNSIGFFWATKFGLGQPNTHLSLVSYTEASEKV